MSSVLIPGERVRARELRRTRRISAFGRVRRLDWLMLFALAGIAALGLDVIGTGSGGTAFVLKQEIYLALGAVALVVLSFFDVERFRKLEWPLYAGTIGLVAIVFLLGFSTRGSRRWIQFPFFQFQPSELGKLTLLLALAALIARNAGRIGTLRFVAHLHRLRGPARRPRVRRARFRHGARLPRLAALRALRGGRAAAPHGAARQASR